MYELLRKLCKANGVAGREADIRNTISEIMTPYCDEITVDNMGNLICFKKGSGENPEKVMLCGHMDEIGFVVTFIEDDGAIRIASMGGINYTASAFTNVVFNNGTQGVLVPESGATPSFDKCYIDIGAKDRKTAEKKVKVGDVCRCVPSVTRLMGTRVCGRPLDDRVGCEAVILVAEKLKDGCYDDMYYVFSVQEEVGCRGAKTAAYLPSCRREDRFCRSFPGTGYRRQKGNRLPAGTQSPCYDRGCAKPGCGGRPAPAYPLRSKYRCTKGRRQ